MSTDSSLRHICKEPTPNQDEFSSKCASVEQAQLVAGGCTTGGYKKQCVVVEWGVGEQQRLQQVPE